MTEHQPEPTPAAEHQVPEHQVPEGQGAEDGLTQEVTQDTGPESSPAQDLPEPTGHGDVDAVVSEVHGLDQVPLEHHVEVFERAHDTLRRTLDARPGDR